MMHNELTKTFMMISNWNNLFDLHDLCKKNSADVRVNPYSAGIDLSRQNLTSVDVRFWRLKSIPPL